MQNRLLSDDNGTFRPGGLLARLLFSGAALAGVTMLTRLFG